MTPARLTQAAVRHQVFLERFKAGQVKNVVKAQHEVELRLLSMLRALEEDSLDQVTRTKFNALVKEFGKVEEQLMAKAVTRLDSELGELAKYEAELEAKGLDRTIKNASVTVPKAKAAFAAIHKTPLSATGDLLEPFIRSMTANAVKQTNRMLQRAYNEGWTVQQMTQALRGTKARNFRDGITRLKTRQAEAVVRTAIQHTASAARFQVWAANGDIIDGYKFIATLDNKTTAVCRSLDGRVFALGKGPTPPVHINCRSTTVPELNDGLDFLDDGATRSAQFGPVDSKMSYYDWLKTQEREFVETAIGRDRAALFVDGGLSAKRFSELQLDKNFQPLTLDEMKVLEPKAFKRAGL